MLIKILQTPCVPALCLASLCFHQETPKAAIFSWTYVQENVVMVAAGPSFPSLLTLLQPSSLWLWRSINLPCTMVLWSNGGTMSLLLMISMMAMRSSSLRMMSPPSTILLCSLIILMMSVLISMATVKSTMLMSLPTPSQERWVVWRMISWWIKERWIKERRRAKERRKVFQVWAVIIYDLAGHQSSMPMTTPTTLTMFCLTKRPLSTSMWMLLL
mmetsp:Transcript_24681/g.38151  ORF Transcript_24681/g.38151 Transcript_24681/m.38151 type:complete len:215 (+) Transcript_24681:4495-5139(+)